jgi:hypothetical protein
LDQSTGCRLLGDLLNRISDSKSQSQEGIEESRRLKTLGENMAWLLMKMVGQPINDG